MNVVLSGGTGFIGRGVIKRLVESGHHVIVLVRPGSLLKIAKFPGTETRYVYFDSPGQMARVLEEGEAIINLVGIIRESKTASFSFAHHTIPQLLAKAAVERGIKRFIQMSALGVGRGIAAEYLETKRLGEEAIKKAAGLEWTIFRPSLVFGPEDHFVNVLAGMLRRLPAVPVIGDGQYRLQPVHIDDVTTGFVKCLLMPQTIGKTYEFGGPDILSYDQMIDFIGSAMGKTQVRKIHLPLGLMNSLARAFGSLKHFPFTAGQINMLLAENFTEDDAYFKDFGMAPTTFIEGISRYLRPGRK